MGGVNPESETGQISNNLLEGVYEKDGQWQTAIQPGI
jgi:hypothetical protein